MDDFRQGQQPRNGIVRPNFAQLPSFFGPLGRLVNPCLRISGDICLMPLLEDVADGMAKRAADLVIKTGDDNLERRIADEIGASSPTLQEAFLTAMRIRKAEARGHALLDKYERGEDIPKAGISSAPQGDISH